MPAPAHRTVEANGISIHLVEQGDGPLVVLCHGFPESWYSWRHQLPALADAGWHAVALDMRGYGRTSAPAAVGAYTLNHLVGDVVGAVAALGEREAVVVGHDWGAPVAWYSALLRPDVFRAVCAMSVPFTPPIAALPEGLTLNDLMRLQAGPERDYYRLFFQEPGVAEADLEADLRRTVLGFLYLISGDAVADGALAAPFDGHLPAGSTLSKQLVVPERLPAWLTEDDVDVYVAELARHGLRGGLNWYRNIDAIPAILSPFQGRTIEQPSCYVSGELDLIAGNTPDAIATMRSALPDLRACELLAGAGHWIQQERADDVTALLLGFLASL